MEQALIRFAKVHGYICATVMVCSGIGLLALLPQSAAGMKFPLPFGILLWSINPFLLAVGCAKEDARWLRSAKRLYIIFFIPGFFILLTAAVDQIIHIGLSLAVFAVFLYGIYVVRFLEKLFTHLQRLRPTTITITTIVCEDPAAAAAVPLQQVRSERSSRPDRSERPRLDRSGSPIRPPLPPVIPLPPPPPRPAAAAAAGTSATSSPNPKEFPTWT